MAEQASVATAATGTIVAAAEAAVEAIEKTVAHLAIGDAAVPSKETSKATADVPAHRSHDPDNNAKRTDPFMFGQRFLTQEDDVFEYNAWDHVETDDAFKEYAEKQYELQRNAPVSDFDKCELFLGLCSSSRHVQD